MGPLIHERQLQTVEEQVDDAVAARRAGCWPAAVA